MPRTTIDDKLHGRSTPKVEHVLALVVAFRDYAAAAGNPLPREFCDEGAWRSECVAMDRALADPQSHDYRGMVARDILAAREGHTDNTAPPVTASAEPSETAWVEHVLRTVGPETAGRELPPKDATAMANVLQAAGRTEELGRLLRAAAGRSAQDVLTMSEAAGLNTGGQLIRLALQDHSIARMAALVKEAEHHHPDEAVGLIHLGVQYRPILNVVNLIKTIHTNGGSPFIGEILSAGLRGRSAREVSLFLIGLSGR
ncbi:hypothetical protein [Streptomyces sp. NPDC051677]|uniref:hypothetical protein n=1 Tax=Streptomyces sp. NPDC051677 TaxID=3365669 RepID=UPI0037CDC454